MAFVRSLSLLIWALCVHANAEVSVKLERDAVIEGVQTRKKFSARSGRSFEWDGTEPLLVSQEENVPLILVPFDFKGDLNVKAIPLREFMSRRIQRTVEETLSDLLGKVVEIQKLSRAGDYTLAYDRYAQLKTRYPDVAFLDFIGASLRLLKGDKVGAMTLAQRASELHPDYAEGKRFINELSAKK